MTWGTIENNPLRQEIHHRTGSPLSLSPAPSHVIKAQEEDEIDIKEQDSLEKDEVLVDTERKVMMHDEEDQLSYGKRLERNRLERRALKRESRERKQRESLDLDQDKRNHEERLEREEEVRTYRKQVEHDVAVREHQAMLEREREIDRQDLEALDRDRQLRRRYENQLCLEQERRRQSPEVLEREHWVHHPADTQHERRPRIVFRHGQGDISQIGPQTLHVFKARLASDDRERQASQHDIRYRHLSPPRDHRRQGNRSTSRTIQRTSSPSLPPRGSRLNPEEQSIPARNLSQQPLLSKDEKRSTSRAPTASPKLHGILKHPDDRRSQSSTPLSSPRQIASQAHRGIENAPYVHFTPDIEGSATPYVASSQ